LLDLIASIFVRAFNLFFHVMPIRFDLWLGRRIGALMCLLSGKRRSITYANLKAAFCGEKTPEELLRITREAYINLGQTFVELMSMTKANKRYTDKFVDIKNMERIREASKNPNGMILVSAHFGNWELSTITGVMEGFPLYLLSRDQKMKRTGELLNMLRESKGNVVIRKGMDIKKIFRVLHEGKSLGILGDQNAGASGKLIDLFGRPASTAVGPYRFAQKSGAWILPAFIHRVKGPYHQLVVEPIMKIGEGDDVVPYMKEYNNLLEKHVRAHPGQWWWMHKKWKLTPLKKVMVLDDGKKGHLKQSLAVVGQIRRYREDEGFAPEHIKVDIVRIRFRSRSARALFNAVSPFFEMSARARLACLRMALDRESYEEAVCRRYADVVVSCGSALSGVNRLLKLENYAKNLTVLDPGVLKRGKFDVVVIPRHDVPAKGMRGDNIVVTEMAPNLVDPGGLAALVPEKTDGRTVIGLLVGGNNPYFEFTDDLVGELVKNINISLEQLDGNICLTTSRRTPETCETVLRKAFERNPRCRMFVLGRGDRDEHTVEKILASSDTVIVSGESISMVSEAVSSGRPVLVFMPRKKAEGLTKYERFVEELRERGHLRLVKPSDIPDELVHIVEKKQEVTLPEDNRRIYEKLYKLF
jgi:KDO2-lipid IV(A) lauroyltransferase